jgi:acetyltransferase-like isoleucine patch superfamily enzyme
MKRIKYFIKHPLRFFTAVIIRLPFFHFIRNTRDYQCPISLSIWWNHKILNRGDNRAAYWPVHRSSKIINPANVYAGVDSCPGLMQGCYIQAIGKIYIGDYTQIGPGVKIVSANHDLYDTRIHIPGKVSIGRYSWLGADVKIMPGVELGDFTIVGAGAVVTRSFPQGHCVIAGNPARVLKELNREKCIAYHYPVLYNGYIRSDEFEEYRKKNLTI